MGLLNKEKAEAASAGFQAKFDTELVKPFAGPQVQDLAEPLTSERNSETFAWSEMLGGFSEWIAPTVWDNLAVQDVTLVPKDWRLNVEVPKKAVDDDAIGIFGQQFAQMGLAGANLPNKLVAEALISGYTDDCYDGGDFFDLVHPDAAGHTQSNTGTGALTAITLEAGLDKMYALVTASGDPVMFQPTHLVVGVGARAAGGDLINSPFLAGGATNKFYKSMELVFTPYITGNDWFIVDLSKGIKPLMLLVRQAPDFNAIIDPSAECVKESNNYQYYSYAREVVGYGFWQLIYGNTGD